MPSPDISGELNLETGEVTEYSTGITRSWFQWRLYVENKRIREVAALMQARDVANDLINLPGVKPWFRDNWYHELPAQVRPNPVTNY